jgi:hypothetical protein
MPLYWLCYRHNNQISVVIEPGPSVIHARMRAALAGLGRALINAQIAAGYALTVRLRDHWYLVTGTSVYGCPKELHSRGN